jgi:aconitate hydratase
MRAKAGDLPRTMVQKIFAGRSSGTPSRGHVLVKADQAVLAKAPHAALDEAISRGLKKTPLEVVVVYETICVRDGHADVGMDADARHTILSHGLVLARAGAGFAPAVHLERFASPARLCVTDEPRLASVGGVGMLSLVVPTSTLGGAIAGHPIEIAEPRSVNVQISGKMRPFVGARDVALELLRRGLGEIVKRAAGEHGAPVVVEFGGSSVRLLSCYERAVIASVATRASAVGAIFPSDERTEVVLRDQRRSKAHRVLAPDAGAPFDDVMQVDLGAVDPLAQGDDGKIRTLREVSGKPVSQVILGGDVGVTLRDLLAAAMLLKSKHVPDGVELLLAPPTRQMLEVLAAEGALSDLIATGARIIEPDARLARGELYSPRGLSLRSFESEEPLRQVIVASQETLTYAVATGKLGDPRGFKRPVRVSVPRSLPTDDVLIIK